MLGHLSNGLPLLLLRGRWRYCTKKAGHMTLSIQPRAPDELALSERGEAGGNIPSEQQTSPPFPPLSPGRDGVSANGDQGIAPTGSRSSLSAQASDVVPAATGETHAVCRSSSYHTGNDPTFFEAFRARLSGSGIPQATTALVDMALSSSAGAIDRSGVAGHAEQSAIASAIKVAVETAVHLGITAAAQTSTIKEMSTRVFGESSKQEALERIQLVSAALSVGNSAALQTLYTTLAAKGLKQPPTAQDFAVGAAAGIISSGILSASAVYFYRTDGVFRAKVDRLLQPLYAGARSAWGRSPSDPAHDAT